MKKFSSTTRVNYRHTSRRPKRLWLIISALVIGGGMLFPWLIGKISEIILYPFHATSTWIKTSDDMIPHYLRSKGELIDELESLKAQVANDTGTQLSIKRLLEENMQLRSMAKAGGDSNRLAALVLSRPNKLSYDLLQIDKGSDDGVVLGAPVYTGVDSVVGVIVHVAEDYSFVDLFTSPSFESTAFIFGPNIFAPMEGVGGGVARVRLPQGVPINVGQMVILPGIDSGVYGEIVRVESEPTQPEQYGYITPPIAINNLRYVSVGVGAVQLKSEEEISEAIRNQIRESLRLSTTSMMYTPEDEEVSEDSATSTDMNDESNQ